MTPRPVSQTAPQTSWQSKLARAEYHIDTLARVTDEWGETNPLTFEHEVNSNATEHTFRIRVTSPADSWGWAAILGDALHNLRGALDHIVFALAMAQTGKDPPGDERTLAFPICRDPTYFNRQRYRIKSLDDPTQAAIERLQPYNRLEPGGHVMELREPPQRHEPLISIASVISHR
jgi:hypothetical protein